MNKAVSFTNYLKSHQNENISVISDIDLILKKNRGSVATMPPPGTDVILLVSGGIDSITTWAMLLHVYQLRVHPLCINTGQKRHDRELSSVTFFSTLFQQQYPSLFVKPFHLSFPSSSPEISQVLRGNLSKTIHPDVLRKYFDKKTNTVTITRKYLFPAFFPYPAALAALLFELTRNVKIRTIFCSILPTDGIYNASQTLTALRSATLSLCTFSNDYSWQVISACFEKEIPLFFEKADLIRWATDHSIPIEKSYTCLTGNQQHCGDCIVCRFRKESFKAAGVVDKTTYLEQTLSTKQRIVIQIKQIVRPIKPLYSPILQKIRSLHLIKKIRIKDYY